MSDPYKEYKQQENDALMLLGIREIFTRFTNEDLIETGIYFIPPEVDVRFVPVASMHLFEPFTHGKIRFLKLHNYDKPATSVRFNTKHKYATYRNVDKSQVHRMIVSELGRAEDRYQQNKETLDPSDPQQLALFTISKEEYEKKTGILNEYLENIDSYEFTVSNYFKFYTYYQATIRYKENNNVGYIEQHLAKTKTNIIFISDELTHKHKEHQHKKIEKYLHSLEPVIKGNTTDLFAHKTKG